MEMRELIVFAESLAAMNTDAKRSEWVVTYLQSPINPLLPTRPSPNLPAFKALLKQLIRPRLRDRVMQVTANLRRRIRSVLLYEIVKDEACSNVVVGCGLGLGFFFGRHGGGSDEVRRFG